jgi:uncharacterized membrane protein
MINRNKLHAIFLFSFFVLTERAFSCTTCNRSMQNAIFDENFFSNLLIMLAPFPLIGLMVAMFRESAKINTEKAIAGDYKIKKDETITRTSSPFIQASLLIGFGMGGFLDGIVFHQVLQWHHMISNTLPTKDLLATNVNMFWDGIFHVFAWIVTLIGIIMLWGLFRRPYTKPSNSVLFGGLLAGWGIFNIAEGLIDHHIFMLHNVKENAEQPVLWNYLFLGISFLITFLGWRLIIKSRKERLIGS